MTRIALLSTSDTDLLCARGSGADYLLANPSRPGHTSMAEAIEAADIVVARILGGPQDLCEGFRRIRATDTPMVVLGGEQTPHAALMEALDGRARRRRRGPSLPRRGRRRQPPGACTPSSATRSS